MQHIIFTKPLASGQPGAGKCIWYLPATYFTANKVAMSTAQHTSGGAHDTVDFLKHENDQLSPKHGSAAKHRMLDRTHRTSSRDSQAAA